MVTVKLDNHTISTLNLDRTCEQASKLESLQRTRLPGVAQCLLADLEGEIWDFIRNGCKE